MSNNCQKASQKLCMSNQQVYPKIEVSVLFIFAPAKKVCPNSIKVYGSDE